MKILELIKKYVAHSRWKFCPPQKRDILIFDGIKNPFKEYVKKSNYNILYRRGEEINLFILLICILKFKITSKSYFEFFIKYANPKIILTAIDNLETFYTLYKVTKVPNLFIQNGVRSAWNDVFTDKKVFAKKNKKKFLVNHMLVFNKTVAKKYNFFITGKTYPIGSFNNNIIYLKKKIKKKKEVLFISTFKPHLIESKKKIFSKFSQKYFFSREGEAIVRLSNLCKKYNLKLNILGRNSGKNKIMEKQFFDMSCKVDYNFFTQEDFKINSYQIMEKYKYVITIDSTLAIENFAKKNRTGFFFNRPYKFPINTRRFGGLEKLSRKGPNWTTYNNNKEFDRVFKFLIKGSDKNWTKTFKNHNYKTLNYDGGNKTFLKIINKYI
tara:strand:- start:648 stop:1793 length:1146 start_codon:yes stop_codon:yes gene_type:complete